MRFIIYILSTLNFISSYCQDKIDTLEIDLYYSLDTLEASNYTGDPCFQVGPKISSSEEYNEYLNTRKRRILSLNPENKKKYVFISFLVTKESKIKEVRVVKNDLNNVAKRIAKKAVKKLKFLPGYCKANSMNIDTRMIFYVRMFFEKENKTVPNRVDGREP